MKSKKTKKILGGVAIAAVSLGCLGLAGIANAADASTSTMGSSSTGSTTASGAYQLGPMTGAMTGSVTITANISAAQVQSGEPITGLVQLCTGRTMYGAVCTAASAEHYIWGGHNGVADLLGNIAADDMKWHGCAPFAAFFFIIALIFKVVKEGEERSLSK